MYRKIVLIIIPFLIISGIVVVAVARMNTGLGIKGNGDLVYLHDYVSKTGIDHGMSYYYMAQVYGWYERGSDYFIDSEHYGTILGSYSNDGSNRIHAIRVKICAKGWYNYYLVDYNCDTFYINTGWWSGQTHLIFDRADRLATRIIVTWEHQYKILWWWSTSHRFTNRTYFYEAMVRL